MKIVLLGYMASGKSVIAKELALKMDLKSMDLDFYIEQKENLKINEIFKKYGEIRFRMLENKYLIEILSSNNELILSLGGGTPCYANNMQVILKHSKSIYLKAAIDTLYERLILEKENRPLISTIANNNLKEFIAKHIFERNTYYNKANTTLIIDNKSVAEITDEIKTILLI